ncbi:MAG: response regulator [Candidatus Aminicenantes bacterium]|nr:response regulator [Candidatus Aminicenantes bacterium]
MKKEAIFLADNSYTIRRIVELSFAEEENVELISFENGLNLKDKLLEIKPRVVLVDIKLPEFNGYETCKFINETEELKDTQVFLMKGGFEPTDENLLKNLTYVDIITKPFDSNALVNTLKDMLKKKEAKASPSKPEQVPKTLPEALPGIDEIVETEEEISFSDIKDEIESDKPTDANDSDEEVPREDVMPSEEKTQGSPPEKDALKFDNIEEIENPFKNEQPIGQEDAEGLKEEELEVKENIREQESELEIASLTQEEINIKKIMQGKEKGIDPEPIGLDDADEDTEAKTDDQIEDTLKGLDVEQPETTEPDIPEKIKEPAKSAEPQETDQLELGTKEPEEKEEIPIEADLKPDEPPEIKLDTSEAAQVPEEKTESESLLEADKEKIITKVEDTLTIAVKKILWEIVPPLAEKIIKEEIQKIKSEIDSSSE